MSPIRTSFCLSMLIASFAGATPAAELVAPAADCAAMSIPNQMKDEDTIRRIEQGWLAAELQGNPQFLECLLEPDYRVSSRDGKVRSRKDVIDRVATVPKSNREVPKLETFVVVHGDSAAAHSILRKTDKEGRPQEIHFVDTFTFRDGRWYAFAGADL